MSSPQAGWYQDPQDPQGLRYWDGVQWTSQTHKPNQPAAPVLGSYQSPTPPPPYQNYSTAQQGSYAAQPVSFVEAAKGLITKWTFRGRASRSEYWFSSITLSLLIFILRAVTGVIGVEAVGYVVLLVQTVLGINLLLIAIRRYHDTGRSGWWLLLQLGLYTILAAALIVTALVSLLVAFGGAASDAQSFGAAALVMLVLFLANNIWLIVWLSLPGKSEKNRFDD